MLHTYEGELYLAAETYVVTAVRNAGPAVYDAAETVVAGQPSRFPDGSDGTSRSVDPRTAAADAWARHAAHANGFGGSEVLERGERFGASAIAAHERPVAGDPARRLVRAYWSAIAAALVADVIGVKWGDWVALALAIAQCAHFRLLGFRVSSLRLQVRGLFLALLAAGFWAPLAWLHPLQLVGVGILLLFDYCVLARVLALTPWQRREPLSWSLVAWTLFTPPGRGSIVERRARARGIASTTEARVPG